MWGPQRELDELLSCYPFFFGIVKSSHGSGFHPGKNYAAKGRAERVIRIGQDHKDGALLEWDEIMRRPVPFVGPVGLRQGTIVPMMSHDPP